MKLKKELIVTVIISMILINIPTPVFAWGTVRNATYEVCNMINICIAAVLRILAFAIAIIYISSRIKNRRSSKEEKTKKIPVSLILIIIQIVVLLLAAFFVIQVGMETYTYGEKYQFFDISDIIRIFAFVAIMFYIIKAIIYFITSEEEDKQKIKTLIIWQIIIAIITTILLVFAKNL